MKKKHNVITISSRHRMYPDKMAMISAFSNLVLLLVTAEITSALNSIHPLVHTVSSVTLISGEEGTMTCNYNRTVYAVYWKYASTTSPMKLLVALDKFYEEGKISGPGYDEGRFNITDDYSLIIHDVQATDEGKYICEVSDYETGSVLRNHTDVTIVGALNSIAPVVKTVSSVTLISGKAAILTCKYDRTVYAVYWRYESSPSPMELLVALDNYFEEGKISGPGYDEGRFDMIDYSLMIHDVQATDEGKYICEVGDYETGQVFRNHTDVTTVVIAELPFVRIEQCEDDVSADGINEPCSLYTTSDDPSIQLTCTVIGAKPMVDITWEAFMSSDQWKQVMNTSILINKARANGIFDQTLTVNVDTSNIKLNKQHFTCVTKGLAVDGMANSTIAVFPAQVRSDGTRTVAVSVVCTLFITFVIIGVLWTWRGVRDKNRRRKGKDPADHEGVLTPLKNKVPKPDKRPLLEKKRRKIKNYQPNKPTTTNKATTHIDIGVFGLVNAGKSSFINSLTFALTGNYPAAGVGATTADNTKYGFFNTESIELTDHINIINFKGMMNFEMSQVGRFFREIKGHGKGTRDTSKGQIYCPIFVCDYSTYKERCRNFMKRFSDDVYSYFGREITVVVTKKNIIGGDGTINMIKEEMSQATGVSKKQIWIFENYTRENHEEDVEKSIEFLDFILQCLDVVTANQKFRKIHGEKIPFYVLAKNTYHALHRNTESDLL